MKHGLLALMVVVTACATLPSPVLQPSTTPIPHRGLNGFYHGEQRAIFAGWLATRSQPLVIRAAVQSVDQVNAALAELPPQHALLLLVEQADLRLVAQLAPFQSEPRIIGIELGNELDLAGFSSMQFRMWLQAGYEQLRALGWTKDIISGGIYSTDDASLQYAHEALDGLPMDLIFGLHPYAQLDDVTLGKLHAFGRRLAATEFGMPSRTPAEDQAEHAYLSTQFALLQRGGFAYALVYQSISGPTSSNLDNFGLFRYDDSGKPALELFP